MSDAGTQDNPIMFGEGRDREALNELKASFVAAAEDFGLTVEDVMLASVGAWECFATGLGFEAAIKMAKEQHFFNLANILIGLGVPQETFFEPVQPASDEDGAD